MGVYKLIFASDFFEDLEKAAQYYEEISIEIEYRFRVAVNDQVKLLKENPLVKSIRYDDVRFARVENFRYAIHYSADEINLEVSIFRLLSDYQNPDKYWQKRW